MADSKEIAKPFKYYESPDGEDLVKKIAVVARPTIGLSLCAAVTEVLLYSRPKGTANVALRLAAVSLPIIGITSTFVLISNGLGSYRKKNDHLNWFVGGFAAGSAVGLWRGSVQWGFNMGLALGLFAVLRKELILNGWELVPSKYYRSAGGVTTCLADYTLRAERPPNWRT